MTKRWNTDGPRQAREGQEREARQGAEGPKTGKVWLVGVGPGDPDLVTVKAARALSEAQV